VGQGIYRVPGHPYTTGLFALSCLAIVASTVWSNPQNSAIGLGILLTGIPVYWYWSRRARSRYIR
jgi:APA family basic amino acid/polyamine antiporter